MSVAAESEALLFGDGQAKRLEHIRRWKKDVAAQPVGEVALNGEEDGSNLVGLSEEGVLKALAVAQEGVSRGRRGHGWRGYGRRKDVWPGPYPTAEQVSELLTDPPDDRTEPAQFH